MGGMLLGTVFGVLIIPGLYYTFGKMISGRQLIRDEASASLSEEYVRSHEERALAKDVQKVNVMMRLLRRMSGKKDDKKND